MGYFIWTFDDSYDSHRATVAPYLRSKGITAGFSMIPGVHTGSLMGASSRLSIQRAREIQDVYGMECYTHACTATDHDNAALFSSLDGYQTGENSIMKAKRLMVAQGLNVNNTHEVFVAPPAMPGYGDPNDGQPANLALARHFIGRRTFGGGAPSVAVNNSETITPTNVFKIRSIGWNGTSVAQIRDAISRARQNPYAVYVLVNHDVSGVTSGIQISVADFQAVANEIAFQRDNNYQSDQSSGTARGKLLVGTLSQLMRGQLAPTL